MRRLPLSFIVLLLCVAGFFLIRHGWNVSKVKVSATAQSGSSSAHAFGHSSSTNTVNAAVAGSVTNKFAWRLKNTDKPMSELAHDPHVILLENAFIDTSAKIDFTIPKNLQAQGDPGAYVVQSRGTISPAFRQALAAAGAAVVSYIPNNAYLVRATEAVANALMDDPLVQAVVPYEPYYKVQGPLLALADKPLPANAQLNLGLFPDNAQGTIQQIQQLGGIIVSEENSAAGYMIVDVEPPKNWTAVAALPGVHIVEASHRRALANDLARPMLGVAADPITETNYMNLYGSNVLVEMNDNGVDTNHPDFSNGHATPPRVFGFITNSPDDGHATHVAGIIMGDGYESTTVTNASGSIMPGTNGQFRGKAPFARLLSVNYGDDDPTLQQTPAENGALISNNSWVFGGDFGYDLEAASYDAATRDALPFTTGAQPVLFVFAAGNDGSGGVEDTIDSPGTAKDIMTVGALEELRGITNQVTNSDGTVSEPWNGETIDPTAVPGFSGCGNVGIGTEGTFGRYKPDVVAPGTFVVSCRSSCWDTNAYYHPTNNNYNVFPDFIPSNSVSLAPFDFFVPTNTVNVFFYVTTNAGSPHPFPPASGLPIYVSTNGNPYTLIGVNGAQLAPSEPSLGDGQDWSVEVSNTTASAISYDLVVDVQTTNWMGNYYQVLQGLNDSLGTEPEYYRYETGTSMAAASISGFLADIEDYFTNELGLLPSPALLKAMTINGARVTSGKYSLQVDNTVNPEGWGLPDLSNSIPVGITNAPVAGDLNAAGPNCSLFFRDQNITNALATGDSETFTVNLNTNEDAEGEPLRVTLAWTDPPGDPSAGIKLVNDLELVVTDLDNPAIVFYGNDIGAGAIYNTPEAATNAPVIDNINNIQNVYIWKFPGIDTRYSVTVKGLSVNANAVTEQTNNFVQDFALVISSGDMSETTDAFDVVDGGVVSNPTAAQTITIGETNTILLNQTAGGNTPLLGSTNMIALTTNSQFTVGMTNQWHFYIITNTTTYANAAFITFGAETMAIPRMGVFADSDANATVQPGPDLDLLVATAPDPNAPELTNLWQTVVSNCLMNVNGDQSTLVSGGTEFIAYTNAQPGQVFYVGVKSESHMGVEYGFVPIFTQEPFGGTDTNGNAYLTGLNVPSPIPDGTSAHPGVSRVFLLDMNPIEIQNVVVTNLIYHQDFGALVGSLTHNGTTVVLNNHDTIPSPPPPGPYQLIYDDNGVTPGARHSDGPGSLRSFDGTSGQGVWILTEAGTVLLQTGLVESVNVFLQKHQSLQNGINVELAPGEWYYNYLDVPPGVTNLELFGTNLTANTSGPLPIQMYLLDGAPPTATDFDFEALLTNPPPPAQVEGNEISDGPPLAPGTYWVGLYNPNAIGNTPANVYLLAVLNGPSVVPQLTKFTTTNSTPLVIDAVTNATISVSNSVPTTISSVNVGMVVQYPRISDLAFTLLAPSGQRILLMENRGGPTATNAGGVFYITNSIGTVTANGSFAAETNTYNLGVNNGTLSFSYDMYQIPDQITVYYGNDPTTFTTNAGNPYFLFNSGMVSGTSNFVVNFGPGTSTYVTVIMNQFGNTGPGSDAWTYTINGALPDYNFLTFTEDTNLTQVPIKFAVPPFDLRDYGTNYTFGDIDFATNGDYFGATNIYDPFGGWTVPSNMVTEVISNTVVTNNYNEVSVVTDPGVAYSGSNFLALGYGIIQRTNFVSPYHLITFSYDYRGPGIAGWWRGEGDGRDSSDAEQRGQNGSLIGRFNFPAGEVGQSFEMENNGMEYNFAGTNSYVQIRQQPYYTLTPAGGLEGTNLVLTQASYLDVGTGPGLTVEGWINPTNTGTQMPLVEWLARVPTNGSDTNLVIRAGPFLYRGTDHYYYMLAATNWTTSETWAQQLGGHLATVNTADEQNWIFDTFADYAGRSRDLWVGLTNFGTNFIYSSGLTNIAYTNWIRLQPDNTDNGHNYTFMYGNTNVYPGLWALADNNGFTLGNPTVTNIVYGVVEVTNLQTNGVSFWISVTNVPGTTNIILTNTGCLFANVMDVSNMSHWIYSAPGLVQSNEFQHVALTYDTNSGIANLFYDGTNVATTNWGFIIPKTTGDVLLGKDMSLETNNYYGGEMDEMSIYGRALSDAEIAAIYSVSAYSTNRLIGKFDPTVTPPESLAEAQVVLGNMTNMILGANNNWQVGGVTFTAQTNALPLQIRGIEPGMLFDSFGIQEAPLGNLYYFPEQSLDQFKGENPNGNWTLEIWNTRNNTLLTNSEIVAWQLQMVLETNTLPPVTVGSQEPTEVTVPPGQTVTLAITPPAWAQVATNILVSSTLPLNVYLNTNTPTVGAVPPDTYLFGPSVSGSTNLYAVPTPTPPPNFIPGETYYIGLQNPGTTEASAVFEVDYNITALTNDVPFNDTLVTNTSLRYFSFTVSTNNPYEATFQLLKMDGNADLVVSKGTPLPTLTNSDYGSFNSGWANENIYVLTNSMPVPLTPGTWYLGVFNRDTHAVDYTVLAQELDLPPTPGTNMTLIQLTNGVPVNFTSGPGAALTNFFYFNVTNSVTVSNGVTVTNYVGSIHFELYNLTGNGDLTVETNEPPFAPPFFQSSDEPGNLPEYIQIQTNSVLTNLAATYYLGVPNETTNLIHYTIIAVIDTNNVFPAFPGAEGAGAGALGASWRNGYTNNTVYHVVNLDDSGPGSLRDAVSSTNRTVIFDISGTIYLQSSLVVTNSYLTIAGQTAPEGGITVAGAPMVLSTNVHDVVIRYVRFRPVYSGQDIFEADWGSGDIIKITPNGTKSTFATGLEQPNVVVVNGAGDVFVTDHVSGNIYKYTPSGVRSTYATLPAGGTSLTFDSFGNLFVANQNTGDIYEIPPGGGSYSTFATGLDQPWGLAFNKFGNLFATTYDHVIHYYTPGGKAAVFASGVSSDGEWGLAFNNDGNLFTGDGLSAYGGVLKFTPGGIKTNFAPGDGIFGVEINNAGNVFAADGGNGNKIYQIAPNGTETILASGLSDPDGIGFAPPVPGQNPVGFGDGLQFNTVSNVIADHISALWSSNNDLSILNSSNVTVQWSILSDTIHPSPTNGVGTLIDFGGGTISLHHNLYADNAYGNPQLGGNISLDFVNNVVYDWGTNAGVSEDDNPDTFTNYLNYICNYVIASTNSLTNNVAFWGGTTNTLIYQTNNFIDSDTNGVLNGTDTRWNMFTNKFTETNQFRLLPVSVDEAYLAYEKVLDFAGVSMFRREPAESNIVENVRRQSGVIINTPGVVPTFSSTTIFVDSANDGVPDFWKVTYGQAVTNTENNTMVDGSGYSELEEFDNWLAGPHALTETNTPVGVDLMKLFGKTGNLSFFVTNAIHGDIYLTNVLGSYTNTSAYSNSIAIFTPVNNAGAATNYSGFASFDVYVTNNDTVGYFGPVAVSVFVSAATVTYSASEGFIFGGEIVSNSVSSNTIEWYEINVPTNAVAATNALLAAGAPMNLWYSTNAPPTTVYPNDFELLTAATNTAAIINNSGAPLPPRLIPGGTYYLGVQNTNNFATNYAVEVTFDTPAGVGVTPIGGGSPVTNTVPGYVALTSGGNWQYYDVLVPTNAIAATNILLFAYNTNGLSGSVNLWFNQTTTPTGGSTPPDYELLDSFSGTTPGIGMPILTTNSTPPLEPGQVYYLGVQNLGSNPMTYALEVNFEYYYSPPILPAVSNLTVVAGNTLTVNDTATDLNAGRLYYFLTTAPPVNATISSNGTITWNVPTNTPGENVLFTTVVSNSFTAQTATNSFTVTVLPLVTGTNPTQTNTVAAGDTAWIAIQVPVDAEWATNILLYATNSPVNVLFTTSFPPATNGAYTLMMNQSTGISVLGTATAPTNITSGGVYYLGVQNNSAAPVGYAIEVKFGLYPPPVLPVITNLVIVAGDTLVVTNTATNPPAPGALVYNLTTAPPVNATISTNGIITWVTKTNQPATNVVFTTVVTNSFTTLSSTNVFTVTVVAYKPPGTIFFTSIIHTNIGGFNGFLLTWFAPTNDAFQVQETPSLMPASWQTFTNVITYTGPVTATNGVFTFFDNGSQYPFGPMRYYRLMLLQPNVLVLPNQPNYIINVSEPLAVTNTALDSSPGATLTYSLTDVPSGSPAPAMNNGIITWTPDISDAGSAFKFTTVVTDNGVPPANAANNFTVFVLPSPSIASATVTATNVTLQWTASTNDLFHVEWTTNLNPAIVWHTFPQTLTSATGLFSFTDTNAPTANRFYRLDWLPLP